MNKKIIYGTIIAIIFIIGLSSLLLKYPFDISGDPFGGKADFHGNPNCGEDRYKFDATINSKNDFVNFIKTHEINQWVKLDNFKNINQGMNYEDIRSAEVDWDKVLASINTEKIGSKTVYVLNYNPVMCGGFILKMTNDGRVSVSGCCGI